jgi:hypothetical protein
MGRTRSAAAGTTREAQSMTRRKLRTRYRPLSPESKAILQTLNRLLDEMDAGTQRLAACVSKIHEVETTQQQAQE